MTDEQVESLVRVLVDKDRYIDQLRKEIEDLKGRLERSATVWCFPRLGVDNPDLPLPRLEMEWWDEARDGAPPWSYYKVEYRLVCRHYLGHIRVVPMGVVATKGGVGVPWKLENGKPELPLHEGVQACFDAAHRGLPLYSLVPGELPMRVDPLDYCPEAYRKGERAKRT